MAVSMAITAKQCTVVDGSCLFSSWKQLNFKNNSKVMALIIRPTCDKS